MLRVAGLSQRGLAPAAIAAQLGVSRSTVSRDLQRLETLWRQEYAHLANAERLRTLAALRESERLCWSLIERYGDDAKHLNQVNTAVRSLLAIQGEIRQLFARVRLPVADDHWGYWRHQAPLRYVAHPDDSQPPAHRTFIDSDLAKPPLLDPSEGDEEDIPRDAHASAPGAPQPARSRHPEVERLHRLAAPLLARAGLDEPGDPVPRDG